MLPHVASLDTPERHLPHPDMVGCLIGLASLSSIRCQIGRFSPSNGVRLATGSPQPMVIRLATGYPQPKGVILARPPRPKSATNSRSTILSGSATNNGSTLQRWSTSSLPESWDFVRVEIPSRNTVLPSWKWFVTINCHALVLTVLKPGKYSFHEG
jgi:hypothetical protein